MASTVSKAAGHVLHHEWVLFQQRRQLFFSSCGWLDSDQPHEVVQFGISSFQLLQLLVPNVHLFVGGDCSCLLLNGREEPLAMVHFGWQPEVSGNGAPQNVDVVCLPLMLRQLLLLVYPNVTSGR